MTKEELISLLKDYKENKARLKIKLKELKLARIVLKSLRQIDVNLTPKVEINGDIQSKNKNSNKVAKQEKKNDEKRREKEEEIKSLEKQVKELREKVEAVEDRLEALKYKERELLYAYYIEGRTYQDIGNNLYFRLFNQTRDADTIKKIVDKATRKMLNL
mgnify:CR=1 FL=1